MITSKPTIALIGPGAIGTTIAAILHEAGHTPTICSRSVLTNLSLQFDEQQIVIPGPTCNQPDNIKHPYNLVFVAVKSTQIEGTTPWLAKLCDDKTIVCVLQNGVEQKNRFSPYVSEAQILPSVVWFPAQRQSATSVWLRGKPKLTLPNTTAAHEVMSVLRETRCAVDLATDFTSIAWRKLLQNAVAGLMVLTGRHAGMFSRTDITHLAECYLQECLSVARAEGAVLDNQVIQEIIQGFQQSPADLGTSILADRVAGRPLEWDVRNGVIKRFGNRHGIATPISDLIIPLLAAASDGPG